MGKRPDLVILFLLSIRLPIAGILFFGGSPGTALVLYGLTEAICVAVAFKVRPHSPRPASV